MFSRFIKPNSPCNCHLELGERRENVEEKREEERILERNHKGFGEIVWIICISNTSLFKIMNIEISIHK